MLARAPSRFVLTVRVPGFGCSAPVFSAGGGDAVWSGSVRILYGIAAGRLTRL